MSICSRSIRRWRDGKKAAGGRREIVPRVDGVTAQEGRAIGHWNSTASWATQQWLACPRAPSGTRSLLVPRGRCRGRRLERCRCGATHSRGAPNIPGNTVIYGAGGRGPFESDATNAPGTRSKPLFRCLACVAQELGRIAVSISVSANNTLCTSKKWGC